MKNRLVAVVIEVAGATVVHGPRSEMWGRSARYRDFDDNVIELTQPPHRGSP